MFNALKVPELKPHQFAVGQAEQATGHVLSTKNNLYTGIGEAYLVFEDFESAQTFVTEKVINHPEIECWIINSAGQPVFLWTKMARS